MDPSQPSTSANASGSSSSPSTSSGSTPAPAPLGGFTFGSNPFSSAPPKSSNKVWTGGAASAPAPGPTSSASSIRPPKPIFGNRSAVFNNASASSSSSKSAEAGTNNGAGGALSAFASPFTPSAGGTTTTPVSAGAASTSQPSAALAFVPSSVFSTKGQPSSQAGSSAPQSSGFAFGGTAGGGGFATSNVASGGASAFGGFGGAGTSSSFGSASSFGAPSKPSDGGASTVASSKDDSSAFAASAGPSAFGASSAGATPSFGKPQQQQQGFASAFGSGNQSAFGGMASTAPAASATSTPAATFQSSVTAPSAAPSASTLTKTPAVQRTMPAAEASSRFSAFMRPGSALQSTTPANGGGASLAGGKNALGGSAKDDEERKKRFEDMPKENRFLELKAQREVLRAQYIKQGILPDPEKQLDLSQAQSLKGTCPTMCPEFEREEREFQNEGDDVEMFPGTNRIDPALAVKIYRRPAAGRELPLPEDVRPPPVLRRTLDYLFYSLMPASPDSPTFTAVQGFLWNRTRAIRQDFIVQSERGALTIECHERIARFHILSVHWKGGMGNESWSEQQELEQLRKTIRSLTEFYDDLRSKNGQTSPNEGEFRAYNLLLHFRDPDTLREVEMLPGPVFDHPCVQAALRLRELAQRSNNAARRAGSSNTEATANMWSRFFGELKRNADVNYLMACLAENLFNSVRMGALKSMSNTYLVQHNPLPIEYIARSLGMDGTDEAADFVRSVAKFEEVWKDGPQGRTLVGFKVCKGQLQEDKTLPSPFSYGIVEAKRGSFTAQDIVDGRASGAVPLLTELDGQSLQSADALPQPTAALQRASEAAAKAVPTSAPSLTAATPLPLPASTKTVSFAPKVDVAPTPLPVESPAREFPSAFSAQPSKGAAFGFGTTSAFGGGASAPAFGGSAKAPSTLGAAPSTSLAEQKTDAAPPPSTAAPASSASSSFSFAKPPVPQPSPFRSTSEGATKASTAVTPEAAAEPQLETGLFSFAKPAAEAKSTEPKAPAKAKSSMPSFFASPGQGKENEAATPAAAPGAKPASAAEGEPGAAVAPTVKAEAPFQPSAAEMKPKQQPKVDPKVAARKFADQAIGEVIPAAVERVAIKALEVEALHRRAEARRELLSGLAKSLTEEALGGIADSRVSRIASNALARRARLRALGSAMLGKWRRRLDEEREMKLQAQRLVEVRKKLQKRAQRLGEGRTSSAESGPSDAGWARRSILFGQRHQRSSLRASLPSKRALRSSRAVGEASIEEDEAMQIDYHSAAEMRSALWAQGTFLETLVLHIDRIATPAVSGFTIGFSPATMPRGGATSLWLAMKLHLDQERHAEIESGTGVLLHSAKLEEKDDEALQELDEEDDLGLVIFECSPELARGEASFIEDLKSAWEAERGRLAGLAKKKAVRRGRFVPALLIVDWNPSDNAGAAESKRKRLFSRLGLTALSETRAAWSNVGLLEVDAAVATDVDAAFAQSVERVLPSLAWNSARRTLTLESIAEALGRPCHEVGQQLDAVVQRARSRSFKTARRQGEIVARTSLALCVALVNLAIRCLVDVSDLFIEDASSLQLPLLEIKADSQTDAQAFSLDDLLFSSAIAYFDSPTFDEDDERHLVDHLRLRLVESEAVSSPFSASDFIASLLRLALERCELHWLSALDGAEGTLASHASQLTQLGLRGVAEILSLLPPPSKDLAVAPATAARKRQALSTPEGSPRASVAAATGGETTTTSSPSKRPRSALSQQRSAANGSGLQSSPPPSSPKTKAVGSLRDAMAAAKALLTGSGSDE